MKRRDALKIEFSQVDLGDGDADGVIVRETICLGQGDNSACAQVGVISATDLTEVPFKAMPHDGVVGLGLDALRVGQAMNFLGHLAMGIEDFTPQFAIGLGHMGGEISFGGYDPTRLAGPLRWLPVARPEDGFWQVWIRSVPVGNITVDACTGGCRGLVDTGASKLGVPVPSAAKLQAALTTVPEPGVGCTGPALQFELDGFSLTLRAEDYSSTACEPHVTPMPLPDPPFGGVYVLGETFLKRYYTVFDWGTRQMGFALATGRFVRIGQPAPEAVGKPTPQPFELFA